MSVMSELENIASEICDGYCRYPMLIEAEYPDPNEAEVELMKICEACPLCKL